RAGVLKDSSLIAMRLFTSEFHLVASPAYLKERGTPKTPADLIHHVLLRFTGTENRTLWTLERSQDKVELPLRGQIQSTQLSAIHNLVRAGTGIGLVPQFLVRRDVAKGSLIRVLPEWLSARTPVHAVYPRQQFLPAKTRAFL